MESNLNVTAWEKIIRNSPDIICTIDSEGCLISMNEAGTSMLGYEWHEFIGQSLQTFVHPDDLLPTKKAGKQVLSEGQIKNFENRCLHKNGQAVFFLWSAVLSEADKTVVCVGRDITEQKLVIQLDELQQVLVEHGGDMHALLDPELRYLYSGGSIPKQLGYTHEQLIGTNAQDYIHPEDIPLIETSLSEGLSVPGQVISATFRFKDATGAWRWIESTLSNQLQNPAIKALVVTSRDVTERINHRSILEESQQRFKSLFDNHLDLVLFKDKAGLIVDANPVARSFFGIPEATASGQSLSEFISPELLHFSEQAFQEALKGTGSRFTQTVQVSGKGLCTFDVSQVPVVVDREIIGVYCLLRDITEVYQSNNIIKQQAQKLHAILESITDACCTLDRNWNFAYMNKEFERLFQTDRRDLLGKHFWNRELGKNSEVFRKQFYGAVETETSARFDVYLERQDVYLNIRAFPSEEGLSIFINDVTDSVKAKQELEKLSLVASKTTNGVVITNAAGLVEWVNEGFTNLTGYTLSEVVGKLPATFLLGNETDRETVERYTEVPLRKKPFQEELMNYKKSGEPVWFLLDTTPVLNPAGEVVRYVTIQIDITDRKEAEANQLQLTKELYRQNKDLQQFTYIVSHNLRSPVANAMGLVNVLSMVEKESETFDITVGYLKKSVNQLDSVLTDLNMILSIRDRRDTLDRESIPLTLVCRQALDDFKDSLQASGGEVLLDIDDTLHVHGDKAYLYSVFHNLLSNAIKYRSPKRPLKINIKCISSTERGKIITFSDNGSGFNMELAGDKVFKLYKRFHSGSDGRGLGLFLVKTHINAMGGHIEVTSQVNVGTKFIIYFN